MLVKLIILLLLLSQSLPLPGRESEYLEQDGSITHLYENESTIQRFNTYRGVIDILPLINTGRREIKEEPGCFDCYKYQLEFDN